MAEQPNHDELVKHLETLATAVGVDERRHRLARYATWTSDDVDELNEALAAQRTIDDSLWR